MSTVNGIGMGNASRSNAIGGQISTSATRAAAASSTKKKTTSQSSKKSRLPYNFKSLSASIMAARTSTGARMAMSKARRKAALLRTFLHNGKYNPDEVLSALEHASKMVRIAKKRMNHLQSEEMSKNHGDAAVYEKTDLEEQTEEAMEEETLAEDLIMENEEQMRQLIQQMQDLEEAMQEQAQLELSSQAIADWIAESPEDPEDELHSYIQNETQIMDSEQRKKKHRSEELKDIMEADMQYLKAMFQRLAQEKAALSSGVSLSLGGVDIPVSAPMPAASSDISSILPDASAAPTAAEIVEGANVDIAL